MKKAQKIKGYSLTQYKHYNKGDKKIGVYVMYFHSKKGVYYYVGMTLLQSIEEEICKHRSAIRKEEKGKSLILQKCFNKILLEYPELDREEVLDKYVTDEVLASYDALGGSLLHFGEDGNYYEVQDNDKIREAYLNKYEKLMCGKISGRSGVNKKFDFTTMTEDELEIFEFIKYEYYRIDNQETYWINKLAETHGREFCLNKKKLKKSNNM